MEFHHTRLTSHHTRLQFGYTSLWNDQIVAWNGVSFANDIPKVFTDAPGLTSDTS